MEKISTHIPLSLGIHSVLIVIMVAAGIGIDTKSDRLIQEKFIEIAIETEQITKAGELIASPAETNTKHMPNILYPDNKEKNKTDNSRILDRPETSNNELQMDRSIDIAEEMSNNKQQIMLSNEKASHIGKTGIYTTENIQATHSVKAVEAPMYIMNTDNLAVGKGKDKYISYDKYRRIIHDSVQDNLVYPFIAVRRKIEGTVLTEFSINAKGLPENIRITKTSGFDILDSAAEKTIVKASPFPVVAGRIEIPITFRLEKGR